MLKKTSASFGLAVATAAGILLSGAPAEAQIISGCKFCHSARIRHHSASFNHNRTRPRIFLRIFIYNRNNNVAVARNGQRQRQRDRQFQLERRRRRRLGGPALGAQDLRGPGILAPAAPNDPARTRSAPVNQPVNAAPVTQSARRDDPRDNGQVSRNGVTHPIQNADPRQNRHSTEEAGQNGIKPNSGNSASDSPDQSDRDISSWLTPALS